MIAPMGSWTPQSRREWDAFGGSVAGMMMSLEMRNCRCSSRRIASDCCCKDRVPEVTCEERKKKKEIASVSPVLNDSSMDGNGK